MTFPALLLAAAALAADPGAVRGTLEHGSWNERIHATHDLAEAGAAALPLLRVAADDADWQVRMTAVHIMGRVGEPAVPDLARTLDGEPCRTVRLTALHWLGAIGSPAAVDALRRGLQDESGMVRLVGRYWLDKGAAPSGRVDPDADAAEQEDLTTCAASPAPARLVRAPAAKAPGADDGAERHETVVTPDPTARRPAEPSPVAPRGPAEDSPTDRARLDELDSLLAPRDPGAPETMPAAPPGLPERPSPPTGVADYEAVTAGPKVPADANAPLRRLLVDPNPAKRARAADDLGKRGAASAPAVGALAAALRDPDRRVRASAALALGNIGGPADPAVPALVAALKRGPEEVAWSAAVALGRIGTPRAEKAFARYARQSAGDLVRGTKP